MWHIIKNSNDIIDFLSSVDFFHDSCIKELQYVSGSYITSDFSMYAINDLRRLNIIIQQQSQMHPTIELEFSGLSEVIVRPQNPHYSTSEILHIEMKYGENMIVFYDSSDDKLGYGIYVCAESVKWRFPGRKGRLA